MKHVKIFESVKPNEKYNNYLTKLLQISTKISEDYGDSKNLKLEKQSFNENDIKKIFEVFGNECNLLIKNKSYSNSVIILIYDIPNSFFNQIDATLKYNL